MLRSGQYKWALFITVAMLGCFGGLAWHLYDVQIRQHKVLSGWADRYLLTSRVLESWRGDLGDRNGQVVALSIPEKTVCLSVDTCGEDVDAVSLTCGHLLNLPCGEVAASIRFARGHLRRGGKTPPTTVVLKHHVPLDEWNAITTAVRLESFGYDVGRITPKQKSRLYKLRHHLLSATDSQARCYPYGETLAQVLGFGAPAETGAGLEGICGLEKTYNAELAGVCGLCVSEQDVCGDELPSRRVRYQPPIPGCNLQLTIDLPLQQMVEQALRTAMAQAQARGASAVIMDPRTGEILAMVAVPSFDPARPAGVSPRLWAHPCLVSAFEPGSVAKMFTLAAALEAGLVTLDTSVYCEGGEGVVAGVPVKDHEPLGMLTVRDAFAKSSNVGFAKIGVLVGPQRLYACMTNFGLGGPTGLPFFGAANGRLFSLKEKSMMDLTRAAFGQGISVSQMQMAIALSVIANDGRLYRPMLVRQITSADGKIVRRFAPQFVRRVVSPRTAQQVREAFKAVVARGGTGSLAASPWYSSGVKTGTAQIADKHGYLKGAYYSSMIGFLPAEAPRLVIAVALDQPRNGYYASAVVAPVFRVIAEKAAARFGIPPDKGAPPRTGRMLCQAWPDQPSAPAVDVESTFAPILAIAN